MCRIVFRKTRRPGVAWLVAVLAGTFIACDGGGTDMSRESAATVLKAPFGTTPAGEDIDLYTLTTAQGAQAAVTNFGAYWVSMVTPDRAGRLDDVVLGYDDLAGYVNDPRYLGATVGRVASRISNARFDLQGRTYQLSQRPGGGHAHGGIKGFNKRVWIGEIVETSAGAGARFSYRSADGEEGYPGTLDVTVTYTLTPENALRIDYTAVTDKPTVVNLTNHAYFNLAGQEAQDVLDHVVTIDADRYQSGGELVPVDDTSLDFREPAAIGLRYHQLENGYDHAYAVNNWTGTLQSVATVYEPGSGRVLNVETTEPCLVLYMSYYLDGSLNGKGGRPLTQWRGLCLEAEHFPDSPNRPQFPSVVLEPGGMYRQTTVYHFSTR